MLNKFKHILLLALTLVTTLVVSSEEEQKHKVTFSPSFLFNSHSSDFENLGVANSCCPGFTSSFGTGLGINLNYQYLLSENWSLLAGLGYNNLSTDFIVEENKVINLDGENPLDATIEQKVRSTLSAVLLNLGAEYNLSNHLDLLFGYRLGLPSDVEYRQTEKILSPASALFNETDSKTRTDVSGSIENSLMHSLFANLAYRFYTNSEKSTYLRPNIGYAFGLNSINQEMNLIPSNFNIGLDLVYSFGIGGGSDVQIEENNEVKRSVYKNTQTNESEIKDLAISSEVIETNKELGNSGVNQQENPTLIIRPLLVNNEGDRQDKNFIYIDEVKSKRLVPLLNYIFFDKDSTHIPIRYSKISKARTSDFSLDSLFDENTLDIYHHVLNIIGKRMIENPGSKLNIAGTKSSDENSQNSKVLAIERAKSVQNYLTDVWGINANRLSLSALDSPNTPSSGNSEEALEENRRVELYSSNPNLLKPVLLNDVLYRPITKTMKFFTVVDTNLKDYNWKLSIVDNQDRILFEDESKDLPPLTLDYNITESIANEISNSNRLSYRFTLTDAANERQSLAGDFNILINTIEEKNSKNEKDVRVDKYSLILFDYDGHQLKESNKDIIKLIKSNINKNSKLTISGYTDKIGDPNYNKTLSEKRVNSVANEFNSVNIDNLYHYGETIILYNNKLPEGRFYSRTVEIEAITPTR